MKRNNEQLYNKMLLKGGRIVTSTMDCVADILIEGNNNL